MSARAFEGLTQLEEIRFEHSHLWNISSYAISNLQNLKILGFIGSTIHNVEGHAISELPNLQQLVFNQCNIGEFDTKAIHILRTRNLPITSDCHATTRGNNNNHDERVMKNMMDRSRLSPTDNHLPVNGSRLIFYNSNISTIGNTAIESDIFAFLVIAGSTFTHLKENAFKVELNNQCEISLLELIQNKIEKLHADSFAHVSGKQSATHKTYFLMNNNTFDRVATNGFRFHPTLEVYMISSNKFICSCSKLHWYFASVRTATSGATTRRQMIEESLSSSSTCVSDDSKLEDFLVNCSGDETTEHPWTSRTSGFNRANDWLVTVVVFFIVLKNVLVIK